MLLFPDMKVFSSFCPFQNYLKLQTGMAEIHEGEKQNTVQGNKRLTGAITYSFFLKEKRLELKEGVIRLV